MRSHPSPWSLCRSALLAAALIAAAPSAAMAAPRDTLTYIEGIEFVTLDPALQTTRPGETMLALMFNRLVRWRDTELSGIAPDLAVSWTTSADGREWTFKLREGVRFHDGTPFDAGAVKFNLDRVRSAELGSPNRSLFAPVTEVEAVDPTTVVLRTAAPYASLLEHLAETAGAMSSPAALQKHGRNYGRFPVGTGPYRLKEWTPGDRLVVERFAGYFGTAGRSREIVYRAVPEGEARVIELEAGGADIVTSIPPESAERVRRNRNLQLLVQPSSFQIFYELNTRKPPFDDPRIRRAINHAVDREAIVAKVLGGYGSVPDSIIPPGVQAHVPIGRYSYDPDLVKRVFAEVYPGGFDGEIELWTPSGRYLKDRSVSEAVQGYLHAVGLKTKFRAWEWSSYLRTLSAKKSGTRSAARDTADDGSLWLMGTSIPTADWRLSRKLASDGSANNTAYGNARVDALLAAARTTLDADRRLALYRDAQRILWEDDPPFLYLYNQVQIIGLRKEVKGFRAYAFEIPLLAEVGKE
ncbi:MAG: glutathione ABC transporter substrate-binding protein [Alphaproteobacteria bacterium]|nr:glutathione ABC transporter substrate-binding protein [Alphaproteobacteria bacterium]